MKFLFKQRLPILTIALMLMAISTGVFLCTQQWLLSGVTFLIIIIIFRKILFIYRLSGKKISYLFNSIDNGDQSFSFSEKWASSVDEMVNDSLNHINMVLLRTKMEIAQKEKYYELVLDSVNTGIIVIDDMGHVHQTNNEALRLLGLTVFTHVRQLTKVDEKLEELISKACSGERYQISYSNERGTINLLIRVSGMILREKSVRIVAINDINTELDQKEQDSWIRLTKVLTHEIMNSITPITSLSETLLHSYGRDNKELKDGLQVIHSTGNGLISFVESYRKYMHIPSPSPELFYVSDFIARMIQLACHQNLSANIRVEKDINPDDLLLYADESLVGQVVLNLLKNAFEAIGDKKEDGLIRVNSYIGAKEEVIIEVRNNGPVIPPEVQEHIFVPFFTTKEKGSGIGLSVSRQIMRLSGGNLTLKTIPDTKETVFTLIFP